MSASQHHRNRRVRATLASIARSTLAGWTRSPAPTDRDLAAVLVSETERPGWGGLRGVTRGEIDAAIAAARGAL